MSIAEELNRIRQAKLDLKEAINAKGGSLTVELLGDYAGAVRNLDSGVSGGVGTEFYKCTQFSNVSSLTSNRMKFLVPLHVPL